MSQLVVFPGNLPVSAQCGNEESGALVVNESSASVYYSGGSTPDSSPDGTLQFGDRATLYGTVFFWVPRSSDSAVVDITPLEAPSPVITAGGGVAVTVTQEPLDGQFPAGTLIVLVDGLSQFVKMWVQT